MRRGLTRNSGRGPHALFAQRQEILAAHVVRKRIGGVLLGVVGAGFRG
jgi:hypothetical protein